MIVGFISDPSHQTLLLRAARPDEDVILDERTALDAVEFGFPRLFVRSSDTGSAADVLSEDSAVPVLELTSELLMDWEARRARFEVPPPRSRFRTECLREAIDECARDVVWIDRVLADLSRAAGGPLPPALRAFARRVLEFPSHYVDLHSLAASVDMTRGALKARFRRRGLTSPYTYLRWFRVIACAHVLADRSVTVAQAAHQLGFTSDGNLCRTVRSLTRLTPTELRNVRGWNRLLIAFAWQHLDADAVERWRELEDIFPSRVA